MLFILVTLDVSNERKSFEWEVEQHSINHLFTSQKINYLPCASMQGTVDIRNRIKLLHKPKPITDGIY